jgi:hypothetical protein
VNTETIWPVLCGRVAQVAAGDLRIIKLRFLQAEKLGLGKSDFHAIEQEKNHEAFICVVVRPWFCAGHVEQRECGADKF